MKKRLLPLALTLCMLLSLLPATAMAAETGNFSDNHVTWIGTQAEYQKTIDNMYVNGMRKMKVEDKWGILDATGEWVAAPIYDSIQLEYLVARDSGTGVPLTKSSEPLEVLFRGGYTQCVRGGKMGLMNQYGEEAIPPQYDAVGLPSEGICRIVKKADSGSYLGYWSLELGRELVAPSKYPVSGGAATAAGQPVVHQMLDKNAAMSGTGGSSNQADGSSTIDYEEIALPNGDRLAAQHDYMGGYAFVTTGAGPQGCLYGSILDKSGKEILPGGPYLYRAGLYPQFGPYMVYCKQSDQPYLARGESLGNPYLSGVVGPQGVIIPAQYSGGIRAPITGWYVGDARMTVIPELQLVITAKDTTPGKENGGKVGVVNFKNQTLIPFTHDFNYFTYKAQPKIFAGLTPEGDRMYTLEGKRLNESSYLEIGSFGNYAMCNGFAQVIKPMGTPPNGNYPAGNAKCFVNLKTGAEIFPEVPAAAHSNFSTNGLAWMMNPQKKWGLMDGTGKMVLPYQYDAVVADAWCREKNGYAIVTSGHQQGIVTAAGAELVPCQYDNIAILSTHGPVDREFAEVTKDGKTGLLSAITGKLVIPCSYASIGSREAYLYQRDYFSLGATLVRTGENDYCLVDRDGNKVPGSDYPHVDSPNRGLFHTHKNGYIGVEGKVIFPDTLSYSGRKNMVTDDSALVVQGGKVGYLAAEKLARPTQPKALNPATAAAAVSPTKLLVDGKAVAASAYLIGQNNYVKLRDLAYLVNGKGKNFEVKWDDGKKAINLKSHTAYTPVAGDMAPAAGGTQTATRSGSALYVDGLGRSLTAYTINGNNYFKLRDVMRVFDIAVGYDNTTGTATLDTSQSYQRTPAEQAGMINASTEQTPPPASQVSKLEVLKAPKLEFYLTGNHTFTTAGFELRYWDEKGVPHVITDVSQMVFKVEGKEIKDGHVFTVSSMKTGTVGYQGLTAPLRFPVYQGVPKEEDPKAVQLADGKYNLSVLGNSVGVTFMGKMILDSKNPTIVCVKRVEDYYYLSWESGKATEYYSPSPEGGQLFAFGRIEASAQKWKITSLGGDTYSIRQYNNPSMLVCTAAAAKKDGTAVMVWKNTKTPAHASFTFTPAQ